MNAIGRTGGRIPFHERIDMKLLLPLLLLLGALTSYSQQRYLVSSRGDAIPLTKGESALHAAQRAGLAPLSGCTSEATFGYTPANFPATTTHIGFHNDIIAEWFTAPASGTLDTVFWFMGQGVCAQDSQLTLRLFKSNIYPGHGPGYGGFPAASSSTCWGYWLNTNDTEDGVAAFPEDATGGWVSTATSGPGPTYPPVDSTALWGLSGVPISPVHANRINSFYLLPVLGQGSHAPMVNVGDYFFMTLKINGLPGEPCCGTCGATFNTGFLASGDTDHVHSHNWKFYENVVTFQAGFNCKGWVARGDFNILFWYVMTATSNLPPILTIDDRIRNTTSTATQVVSADIVDCDPANPAKAGVENAVVKYSVNGGPILSAAMTNIGADRWEGNIPGQPKGTTVSYRIVGKDSLGLADSTGLSTYRIIDLNSAYYRCDTTLSCTPMSIIGTGTVIDTSKWFLPPGTTNTHPGDDGTAGPYSLGGPFVYYGDTLNYAWIGVNGAIALSKNATDTLDVNANGFATDGFDLPQRQHRGRPDTVRRAAGFMPKNFIAPYWGDWIVKQDSPLAFYGHIRTSTTAFPGKFIAEWDSVGDFDASGAVIDNDKFRVIIDRTAGSIQFQIDDIGIGGLDTVNLVGMNSDSSTHLLTFPTPFNYYNKDGVPTETHIHSGLCVSYYPEVYITGNLDGWNMVSVGCIPPSYAKSFLFPNAISYSSFGYHGSYQATQTLKNGPGYWLKFLGGGTIDGPGMHLASVDDSLDANWNMVGSVSTPVAVGTLTTTPPSIITSPFFGFNGSYTVAATLTPGRGYWVKTNAPGKLHIVGTGAVPKESPVTELAGLSKVTVEDNLHRAQTLYIGSEATLSAQAASKYEMPPMAPEGALNVRFTSQRMVEVFPAQPEAGKEYSYAIMIQGAAYPLTVKWEAVRGGTQKLALQSLNGKDTKTLGIVEGSGKLTINDAGVTKLALKLTEGLTLPKEFALSQNYPNPFNPTTHFSVDIPKASTVDVVVYDVLGRRIATLMSGEQEAGYHVMEWDSKDSHGLAVPSGMYMVRMTAGDFTGTRKIMLMK